MKKFFNLLSREDLLSRLSEFDPLESEKVEIAHALGRVISEDVRAPEDLPPFSRSTMDGFALKAKDTFGCSESEPALFNVVGEVPMGSLGKGIRVGRQEVVRIWTGGAIPQGADSVVMLEYTHALDDETIEVFRPVAPGENVISTGEDFRRGAVTIRKGRVLKPMDLGALAGLGISHVKVYRVPRVAILSTGDELVPPNEHPGPGQIRDINTTTLSALVSESGGIPIPLGIVGDDLQSMIDRCHMAIDDGADIVLLSGGSSVGRRDFTLEVFKAIDGANLLCHGVAIRPGKPTILAKQGNRAFFGLPGHVASSIVVFYLFVQPLIHLMSGKGLTSFLDKINVMCGREFPSVSGREDFIRVKVEKETGSNMPVAFPVWGKSGLISPLVEADGLLIVPRDSEGLEKGEVATVLLF